MHVLLFALLWYAHAYLPSWALDVPLLIVNVLDSPTGPLILLATVAWLAFDIRTFNRASASRARPG